MNIILILFNLRVCLNGFSNYMIHLVTISLGLSGESDEFATVYVNIVIFLSLSLWNKKQRNFNYFIFILYFIFYTNLISVNLAKLTKVCCLKKLTMRLEYLLKIWYVFLVHFDWACLNQFLRKIALFLWKMISKYCNI